MPIGARDGVSLPSGSAPSSVPKFTVNRENEVVGFIFDFFCLEFADEEDFEQFSVSFLLDKLWAIVGVCVPL